MPRRSSHRQVENNEHEHEIKTKRRIASPTGERISQYQNNNTSNSHQTPTPSSTTIPAPIPKPNTKNEQETFSKEPSELIYQQKHRHRRHQLRQFKSQENIKSRLTEPIEESSKLNSMVSIAQSKSSSKQLPRFVSSSQFFGDGNGNDDGNGDGDGDKNEEKQLQYKCTNNNNNKIITGYKLRKNNKPSKKVLSIRTMETLEESIEAIIDVENVNVNMNEIEENNNHEKQQPQPQHYNCSKKTKKTYEKKQSSNTTTTTNRENIKQKLKEQQCEEIEKHPNKSDPTVKIIENENVEEIKKLKSSKRRRSIKEIKESEIRISNRYRYNNHHHYDHLDDNSELDDEEIKINKKDLIKIANLVNVDNRSGFNMEKEHKKKNELLLLEKKKENLENLENLMNNYLPGEEEVKSIHINNMKESISKVGKININGINNVNVNVNNNEKTHHHQNHQNHHNQQHHQNQQQYQQHTRKLSSNNNSSKHFVNNNNTSVTLNLSINSVYATNAQIRQTFPENILENTESRESRLRGSIESSLSSIEKNREGINIEKFKKIEIMKKKLNSESILEGTELMSTVDRINFHIEIINTMSNFVYKGNELEEVLGDWDELNFMVYKKFYLERTKILQFLKKYPMKNPFCISCSSIDTKQILKAVKENKAEVKKIISNLETENKAIKENLEIFYNQFEQETYGEKINLFEYDNFSNWIYKELWDQIHILSYSQSPKNAEIKDRICKGLQVGFLISEINGNFVTPFEDAELSVHRNTQDVYISDNIKLFDRYVLKHKK